MDVLTIVLIAMVLVNSSIVLLASIVTLIAAMNLLRYARKTDQILDQLLFTVRELGKIVELAIWRG